MSHVTEKLAEFIFEELPAAEMARARQHLADCSNCRDQVERFQQTLAILRSAPAEEPPRSIVFEFEKPARRLWKWFPAAAAIAALVVMTIALAGRVHVEWRDSQVTVAFGQSISGPEPDPAAELALELERVKGHLAILQSRQDAVERDTTVIAATVEPLTRGLRSPAGD
jgi:predicted anti-sigma-YlaC factor YlaD